MNGMYLNIDMKYTNTESLGKGFWTSDMNMFFTKDKTPMSH